MPRDRPPGPLSRGEQLVLGAVPRDQQRTAQYGDPGADARVVLLGTFDAQDKPKPLRWDDPVTENPVLGATEIWEIHNLTNDAHPIHVHELQFQVVDRQPLPAGSRRPPEAGERGFKDTVIAPPHAITRIKLRFGRAGRFMWHCHMLEYEDNEMMRPFLVRPA
ncbi:multicopper oxidase domain-containing protein [Streptomyces sp. NPDC004290]